VKKILFVTTSSLELENYSGDSIRAQNIIKFLKKKNKVDIICTAKDNNQKKIVNKGKIFFFKKNNFLLQIFYTFVAAFKLEPLQLGYFYSTNIKNFLQNNYKNYDTIVFHLIRSAQYLPKKFKGRKILEMTDLMSNNYSQTKKNLSGFNPFFYLYLLEGFLVKKYERLCSKIFDKIVLVSKKDLDNSDKKIQKNIVEITNGIKKERKTFRYNKKNYKVLFIGNINYLPNKYACYDFAKNILPSINQVYPKIEFHIIGKINFLDKIYLGLFKNVKVLGKINSLKKNINLSICGISNLKIATGFQNKIFTYISYALPAVISLKSSAGIKSFQISKELLIYKDKKKFIKHILQLKKDEKLSNKLSKNSYFKIKNFSWENTLKKYTKII